MKKILIIGLGLFLISCVNPQTQLRQKQMELLEQQNRLLELKQQRMLRCMDDAEARLKSDFKRCEDFFKQKILSPAEFLQCQHNAEVIYNMEFNRCSQ
jgi:hypothetical protein